MLGVFLTVFGTVDGVAAQDSWSLDIFKPKSPPPAVKRTPSLSVKRRTIARVTKEPAVNSAQVSAALWQWRIKKELWSEVDEKSYEDFVARIGESNCRSLNACLTGADSNPMYQASNPPGMDLYADCADLPYVLRAYFAWKNELPFSYSTEVSPISATRDIRYTTQGNRITARHEIVGPVVDARRAISRMVDAISSAHYRYPPAQSGNMPPDHYPVKISRKGIKPGTIIYDPNGHVAVVYKVSADGRIHYIDTHPDNSLTRGVYGRSFVRSSPGMGGGFKRWRPQRLVGATRSADGYLSSGSIVLAQDQASPEWSDEQFYGTVSPRPKSWRAARFVLGGDTLDYYEFVRKRLAGVEFRYNPIHETRAMIHALCEEAKYRIDAVAFATAAGIQLRPQPPNLPLNIYGAEGDWEIYSTPSRDARLKTSFKELRDEVARFLTLATADPSKLDYLGDDLKADLSKIWREEFVNCRISYAKSDGTRVTLNLLELQRRLFRLSFDPYHCIERRWGADDELELSSCSDGDEKRAWYEAEQRLRNQTDRTYQTRMGFSLRQLQTGVPGSGISKPPDINLENLLTDVE